MTGQYRCPTCTGEFPADAIEADACPWCGQELGEVDGPPSLVRAVRSASDSEEAKPFGGLFQ